MKLKDVQRPKKRADFSITSVNLTIENYRKMKKLRINLSKMINTFLKENDLKYLRENFNTRMEFSNDRKVTSLHILPENITKKESILLSYLANFLIETIE